MIKFLLYLWRLIFPKKQTFAQRMSQIEKTTVPEHAVKTVKKAPRTINTRKGQPPGKVMHLVVSQPSRGDAYRSKFRKRRRKQVELVRIISLLTKDPFHYIYRIAAA